MKNFKFIISYDGSRYFGWERQPGRDIIISMTFFHYFGLAA